MPQIRLARLSDARSLVRANPILLATVINSIEMLQLSVLRRQRQMPLLRIEGVMTRGALLIADNIGVARVTVAAVQAQGKATAQVRVATAIVEQRNASLSIRRPRAALHASDCEHANQKQK
jgi:hypothetical protein